jgi:hypothetical protein
MDHVIDGQLVPDEIGVPMAVPDQLLRQRKSSRQPPSFRRPVRSFRPSGHHDEREGGRASGAISSTRFGRLCDEHTDSNHDARSTDLVLGQENPLLRVRQHQRSSMPPSNWLAE